MLVLRRAVFPLRILVPQGTVITPDCLRNTNPGYTLARETDTFLFSISRAAAASLRRGVHAHVHARHFPGAVAREVRKREQQTS